MGQIIRGRSPNWKHHNLNFHSLEVLGQDLVYLLSTVSVSQWQGIPPPKTFNWLLLGGCNMFVINGENTLPGEWHVSTLCCLELHPCSLDELRQTLHETTGWLGASHETGDVIHEDLHRREDASTSRLSSTRRFRSSSYDNFHAHYKNSWGYCASHWYSNFKKLPTCDIIIDGESHVELVVVSEYCGLAFLWNVEILEFLFSE